MRKIISREKEEKKRQRNQIILGVILIFVMFFSVLGYGFSGSSESSNKVEYNGFEFYEKNSLWYLEIDDFYLIFKNNPKEIENIEGKVNSFFSYYNQPLYISSDNNEAYYEIYNNFDKIAGRIQFACLNKENCDGNFPIKTCENNFIIIRENNESRIFQNESCVFIEGPSENLIKLTDEFIFKTLDIKE
jgi:hypothetical protein